MAQWSNTDVNTSSVLWGVAGFKKRATATNRNNFFGNNTADAYITGMTVGQYGVDKTEIGITQTGPLASLVLLTNGTGYTGNAAVTISGGGGSSATANAHANTTGKIDIIYLTANGSSFESVPTVAIDPPAAITFNANSDVSNTADFITLSGHTYVAGDATKYLKDAGNTAITGLSNNTWYYVSYANSTGIKVAATLGGANINLTTPGVDETGHSFTGQTATATATLTLKYGGIGYAHAGWNVRKEWGNGRVATETLVAMSKNSLVASDASDDTVLPDA